MNPCHPTTLHDLRDTFGLARVFAPDPSSGPSLPDDDDEPDPPSAEDTENHDSDDTAGGGEGQDEDDEPIDNPELKALHDEAAKWRRQFRDAQERIQQLEDEHGAEALRAENRELRLRLAFERATGEFRDVDAAWKLAQDDLTTVDVDEDGTVDANRIGEIANALAQRHPYLVEPPDDATDGPQPPPAAPSGRPVNGRRTKTGTDAPSALERKFPALRGRR